MPMTMTIAAIIVIGFLFTLGCGCGCCYCTSCSQADDEAATYEVTITGVTDGSCCTGCASANGTFNMTFEGVNACTPISPLSQAGYGCCYSYIEADTNPDCVGCGGVGLLPTTRYTFLFISSNASETSAGQCAKTLTTVTVNSDMVAGWLEPYTYMANFQDLADPILDCSLASYNARSIPFTGSATNAGCDWWTTPATCTVTRT